MSNQDTFNLNRIFRVFSAGGDESLQISVYGQVASLVIFKKNTQDNRPVVKFSLDYTARTGIAGYLQQLLDSPPNTRLSAVQKKFNRDQKTYEVLNNFVFFKDENNMIGIEVVGELINPAIKFMLKVGNNYELNEPMDDAQKSACKAKELIHCLTKKLDIAELLSTYNMPNMSRPKNSGGGNSNSNYRNNDNRGSYNSRNNDIF